MKTRALCVITVLAAALAACGAAELTSSGASNASGATDAASGGTNPRLVRVVSGLNAPVYLTIAPGGGSNLYVVEKAGRIRIVRNGHVVSTFLDIRSLVGSGGTEQGLFSVAFHPRYASNHLFYVDYTDRNGNTRVMEYRARPGRKPVFRRQLLFVVQPYPNHNGGQLQFGPDGDLYVGMGDGGSEGDPQNHSQNLSSRLGKLLKINVNLPGARWQIAGYGLRNPWRFSFDRSTGDLWIGDVGQNNWEEVDFTPRSFTGLANYGWRVYEANHRYTNETPNSDGTLRFPIYEYSHDNGNCSITGGYVYRGSAIPSLQGRYFFGDFCSGSIWSLMQQNGSAANVTKYPFTVSEISSFGQGPGGELYLVSLEGQIYKLA